MSETPLRDPAAELARALAAVQAELPEVKKTRTAKVEKDGRLLYTYDYADLADVSAAIMPILGRHELAFTAFPGHQADGKFGLRYHLLHSGGASLEGFYAIDDKGGMQMVGGRITYARRYCLCAVTGVAADEDVDAREDERSRTAQRRPRASSPPPAQTATRPRPAAGPVPVTGAGGDLPPLPGEVDHESPGTVTDAQLTRIWTTLTQDFAFGRDEKDQARGICAQIARSPLGSSKDLSFSQAKAVVDTLARWQKQADVLQEEPRGFLVQMLNTLGDPREDDAGE